MIKRGMRGLDQFGAVLQVSTGTVAQGQQQRSAWTENAIAVPSTAGGDAKRSTPARRNLRYTICRDDVRLISFARSPELNQKVTAQPDGFAALPNVSSLYVEGYAVDAVKKGILECLA